MRAGGSVELVNSRACTALLASCMHKGTLRGDIAAAPAASAVAAEGGAAVAPVAERRPPPHRVCQRCCTALGGAIHILGGCLQEGGCVGVVACAVGSLCGRGMRAGGKQAAVIGCC